MISVPNGKLQLRHLRQDFHHKGRVWALGRRTGIQGIPAAGTVAESMYSAGAAQSQRTSFSGYPMQTPLSTTQHAQQHKKKRGGKEEEEQEDEKDKEDECPSLPKKYA